MPNLDFEEFAFTPLHKAVLGIGPNTVGKALQQCSFWDVNTEDVHGRTALSWAAQRGDFNAMSLLLRHHADPHTSDLYKLPLLFRALRFGSPRCVQLLLDSGVDVDQLNGFGYTPLIYLASRKDTAKVLDLLLEYQPQLNFQGTDRDSALLAALEILNFEMAQKLILCGADIHIKERAGYNALSVAILFNAHDIILLLLERQADHHGTIKQHGTLLHLVAEMADIKTLGTLTNNLAKRNIQAKRGDGKTAVEVGLSRTNTTIEWQNAFYVFMWSVDAAKTRVSPAAVDLRADEVLAQVEDSDEDVFVDASEWR